MKYSSKHMLSIAGGLVVAGLLAAGQAGAADTGTSLSSKGASFVKEASAGNQSEIAHHCAGARDYIGAKPVLYAAPNAEQTGKIERRGFRPTVHEGYDRRSRG